MKTLIRFIAVAGAMMLFAGCGDERKEAYMGRMEITPPLVDLTFDEAFVKDRDIRFNMPEGIVLGQISYIVINSKGDLIVSDWFLKTLFQTDAEGNYLRQIGRQGGGKGQYYHITKLAIDKSDDLYIESVSEGIKYMVYSGDPYKLKKEVSVPTSAFIDHFVITEEGNIYASKVDGKRALFRLDDDFTRIDSLYPVEDQRTATALHRYHNTILTPKEGGGFYFMYPTVYEIHQYSERGELERTLFSHYRSKHRDGIRPFPVGLAPNDWNSKIEGWFANHIVRSELFECDPNLLVLMQYRKKIGRVYEFYLNVMNKDGTSLVDGIRLPEGHSLVTIKGSELYFRIEGEFNEATGEMSDPYMAVYRFNDRTGAGKIAFSRS